MRSRNEIPVVKFGVLADTIHVGWYFGLLNIQCDCLLVMLYQLHLEQVIQHVVFQL